MGKIVFAFIISYSSFVFTQVVHPIEPSKNHYKELKKLNATPRKSSSRLDTISFTPDQYNSVALSYILMAPAYLTSDQITKLKKRVNFPANSSEQTKAELNFLLEWQEKRTSEQVYRTSKVLAPIGYWPHINVKQDHENYVNNREHLMFEGREVLGDKCTIENYPNTFKLLQGVTKDMRIMEFSVKYHLLRARPYVLEPKLQPLAIMGSPSFASGHTLWAYIQAFVWSELVPDKRTAFLELAYEIGESREIMGIHYPSDEEAARILAHDMLSVMWNNPKFQVDLEEAKAEWKN